MKALFVESPDAAAHFRPTRVLEIELSEPIADILPATTSGGVPFVRARILVRIHTWPLGFVDVDLGPNGLSAASLAAAIDAELGTQIARHQEGDSSGAVARVDPGGIPEVAEPACLAARRETLRAPPSVSVVVPTVDRPEALRRTIQDLVDQSYPDFEILVVDNAPGQSGADGVVSSIDAGGRTMRYLVEERRGASRARNRGLHAARGEIVAFVDGDVRVDRSWLAAIATSMSSSIDGDDMSVSCVTGAILPAALETQAQQWMEEWGGYSKGFEQRIFDLRGHRTASPLYPFAAAIFGSGAQMAFRTNQIRELGGFDPALGGGTPSRSGEDLAVFLDLVSSGRTLVYEPGAIVWHPHPVSEAQFRATLRSYGRGLTSYLLRHVSRHPRDAVRIALAIAPAVDYFFRADSPHNSRRSASFPRGIWRDEIAGMLVGPFAYAVGRARARGS
jgi:glycosyltransferase involved in cell wall biosynthesis